MCRDSIQFGTQNERTCWCSANGEDADYDIFGISTDCTYECRGDETETCGGKLSMSVYEFRAFAIEGELLPTPIAK